MQCTRREGGDGSGVLQASARVPSRPVCPPLPSHHTAAANLIQPTNPEIGLVTKTKPDTFTGDVCLRRGQPQITLTSALGNPDLHLATRSTPARPSCSNAHSQADRILEGGGCRSSTERSPEALESVQHPRPDPRTCDAMAMKLGLRRRPARIAARSSAPAERERGRGGWMCERECSKPGGARRGGLHEIV